MDTKINPKLASLLNKKLALQEEIVIASSREEQDSIICLLHLVGTSEKEAKEIGEYGCDGYVKIKHKYHDEKIRELIRKEGEIIIDEMSKSMQGIVDKLNFFQELLKNKIEQIEEEQINSLVHFCQTGKFND